MFQVNKLHNIQLVWFELIAFILKTSVSGEENENCNDTSNLK